MNWLGLSLFLGLPWAIVLFLLWSEAAKHGQIEELKRDRLLYKAKAKYWQSAAIRLQEEKEQGQQ